eukprot:3480610-Rhodomonas_salina.1
MPPRRARCRNSKPRCTMSRTIAGSTGRDCGAQQPHRPRACPDARVTARFSALFLFLDTNETYYNTHSPFHSIIPQALELQHIGRCGCHDDDDALSPCSDWGWLLLCILYSVDLTWLRVISLPESLTTDRRSNPCCLLSSSQNPRWRSLAPGPLALSRRAN